MIYFAMITFIFYKILSILYIIIYNRTAIPFGFSYDGKEEYKEQTMKFLVDNVKYIAHKNDKNLIVFNY